MLNGATPHLNARLAAAREGMTNSIKHINLLTYVGNSDSDSGNEGLYRFQKREQDTKLLRYIHKKNAKCEFITFVLFLCFRSSDHVQHMHPFPSVY
ncbi:hypothetical protein AVEN_106968-1 [Araneus ventricosus]|uniref:Uncharacterized protein n=1 Tax=Araneus ventricosus TaxID=182803 RepID=A0A4Y2QB73_ARAVE|nr:hypothetical protein AVEN_106968-1 [Araneus ventricosus]